MPQLRFRRFSRLDFIQSINIEQQLVPLLGQWRNDLLRLGLDLQSLRNDEPSAQRVFEVFTTSKDDLPGDLLETLYILDELSDEDGEERLRTILTEEGAEGDIPDLNGDWSHADFAILVYRNKSDLVFACHDESAPRKVCKYVEWRGKDTTGLTLAKAKGRKGRVETAMAAWFASKGRGRVCEIHVYKEDDDLAFVVVHGQKIRSQGSYTAALKRARTSFRPQRHDTLIWDSRRHVLLVHASTVADRQRYREVFGRVYWGSDAYFDDDRIYSLAALQRQNVALSLATGVTEARMVEAVTQIDDGLNTRQVTTGHNLLASFRDQQTPDLMQGTVISAGFLLTFGEGRPRRLDIRIPNMADYDRDRDGVAVRKWLDENRFLVRRRPPTRPADAENDDTEEEEDGSGAPVARR